MQLSASHRKKIVRRDTCASDQELLYTFGKEAIDPVKQFIYVSSIVISMASGLPARQGVKYISNLKSFAKKAITAEDLRKFSKTIYGRGLYQKLATMVFNGPVSISVFDPENNIDEETQIIITKAFFSETFSILTMGHLRLFDKFFYGPTIFNPIWEKNPEGVIAPVEVIRLPPYSFNRLPSGRNLYSDLLPGITMDQAGENIEIWQSVNNQTIQLPLDDLMLVQSPVIDGLVESPMIEPIIPFIDMLLYGWETSMQVMKRGAAPIIFIKILNPQPASEANGWISDEDYALTILENWDKDTAFALRDNMEIIEYKYENGLSLDIIDALYYTIIDYLNPATYLNKEGQLIGGSTQGQLELIAASIGGIQTEIEEACSRLVNRFFLYNSYPPGYRAEVKLKRMDCRNRELDIREADLGAKYKALDPNEFRRRLGAEGVSDEELARIAERWKLLGVSDESTTEESEEEEPSKGEKKAARKLSKSDLPDVVLRDMLPDPDTLSDSLEHDLRTMIDEATKEIIEVVRKSYA